MKRRYWILAALAAIAVLLLAGCTSTEQDSQADASAGSDSAKTGSTAIADIDAADAEKETADTDNSDYSDNTDNTDNTVDTPASAAGASQEATVSQTDDGYPAAVSQYDETDSGTQQPETAGEETEETVGEDEWIVQTGDGESEEDAESSGQEEDNWSGTYIGDNDTVTLQLSSSGTLTFSFRESGISGTAVIKDGQAVYEGDDQNDVVFQVEGSLLDVSVTSKEDLDTSGSPLNGTYIRSE